MATDSPTIGWSCDINNLSHWIPGGGVGGWRKYFPGGSNSLCLRIYHDLLVITHDDKAVEALNLVNTKMKAFLKGFVMILAISNENKSMRKIKFELRCSAAETAACVGRLAQFMSIEDRNTKQVYCKPQSHQFRSLGDTLQSILEKKNGDVLTKMPTRYEEFVRLCVLDPDFPQLVAETEIVVKNLSNKQ